MLRKDPLGGGGAAGSGANRASTSGRPGAGAEGTAPGGRRPLLFTFEGNNRQMLIDIKDSLNHVVKKAPNGTELESQLGGKSSELSHSTPNLLDNSVKTNGVNNNSAVAPLTNNHKMSRFQYNQRAMAEIQKSLERYEVHDGIGHGYVANGMDIEVTPVNKKMLQQLMSMGADEDVATRALKISGNKGVDAALETIQKLSHQEGRNGFTRAATGLQGYGSKVIRKPSFEEKYGKSSPVHSENSSIRSESPNMGRAHNYGVGDPMRQTMHHQTNLTVPGHHHQMFPADRQPSPPPPLPPRAAHSGPAPPPVPPQTYKAHNNGQQQAAVPSAFSRRMSPISRDSPYRGTPTPQQSQPSPSPANSIHSGPVTPQRGMSPSSVHQPVIKQQQNLYQPSMYDHRTQGLMPPTQMQPGGQLEDSGYVSAGSGGGGAGPKYRNPPPYTHVLPSKPQQQTFYNDQNSIVMTQHSASPLSSHSPSPAPTPQSHSPMITQGGAAAHKQPVPVQAWNAKQPPIFLQQVKSREVPKPVLQTATAPISPPPGQAPPPQRQYQGTGGDQPYLPQQQNQYSYITEVSTKVNQPHLQVNFPSANSNISTQSHSNAEHQFYPQLQQQQHQQQQLQQPQQHLYQGQNIHSVQIRKGSIEHIQTNTQPYQYAPGMQGAQMPGRTINIQIQNNGSTNHTIQVQPGYGVTHYSTQQQEQRVPPLHPVIDINRYQPQQTDTTPGSTPRSRSPEPSRVLNNQSPLSVISTTSTPSTNSDFPDKPPPPYPGKLINPQTNQILQPAAMVHLQYTMPPYSTHQPLPNGAFSETSSTTSSNYASSNYTDVKSTTSSNYTDISRFDNPILEEMPCDITPLSIDLPPPPEYPHPSSNTHEHQEQQSKTEKTPLVSPKPIRRAGAEKKDEERRMSKVRNYTPEAFKFYMEQHIENVLKTHQARTERRMQLEAEMNKVRLSEEARKQVRLWLNQKESNHIRLKRANMDKSMFEKIKTLGIGAFGEVALVQKKDNGALYAMKTLRKSDVLQRNQAAHVRAERDILSEVDNDWVVKLYHAFQDKTNLYFVMAYIPGGDMMSLLIKKGIFEEPLAQFYIAELVLAIESVHDMGFIHRDIKPDNILIDKDGHIKLTDFGLCTGFRWTHDSKYYQKGNHARQDSMEPSDEWGNVGNCQCTTKEILKPLERRRKTHQRCLAHSLVGTPNYIAPEVLQRSGYTNACDWWSVGVILYEMLVGQPPFMANTPTETQIKVINWRDSLRVPPEAQLSPSSTDLILRLCASPETRLGVNGADEIKQHLFFADVRFETLRRQKALYIPKIRDRTDTSNFDPVDPDKIRQSSGSCDSLDTLKHDGTGGENGKYPDHAFFDFTFRRFFDDGGHPLPVAKLTESKDSNDPVYV